MDSRTVMSQYVAEKREKNMLQHHYKSSKALVCDAVYF